MSGAIVQPYLFFNGRCDEAIAFYTDAIGAKVEFLMRYKDAPETPPPGRLPPGFENKVMHANVSVGGSFFMISDGCDTGTNFAGFSLSLTMPTEAEAVRAFNTLGDGGKVTMPIGKTFWSPCFGMLTDKFGVSWMVTIPG